MDGLLTVGVVFEVDFRTSNAVREKGVVVVFSDVSLCHKVKERGTELTNTKTSKSTGKTINESRELTIFLSSVIPAPASLQQR